jgi:DNA repair exonuclease SbcCD ATPase subunit
MAGTLTDREIMAQEDRFAPLMDSLGKLSISDYKAKLMHQKKGLTGVRDDAPTRINECTKTIQDIEGMDFAGMRQELEALNSRKDSIRVQILQLDDSNAADAKRMEIREAQLELGKLDAENKTHRARQTAGTVDVDRLRFDLSAKWQRLDRAERVLEAEKQMVSGHEERIGRAREQWISTNDEAFTGGTCPSCGQALPPDRLRRAQESFEARKQRRLAEIEESAADLRSAKAQAEDRVKRQTEDIQQLKAEIIALEKEVYAAEQQTVVVEDLPHYAENAHSFREQIHRLNGELADIMADNSAVKSRLRTEQEKIQREIDALAERIGRESLLNYSRRRIEELKADAQNAAEALESIESMLYLMEEFTRFKAKYVEQSINDHFRIATFRLFREQANGGLEERCDAQHDGVPFLGLNNGMKVNVGIDIINALSRHYGVTVPLFVDNAEAVTRLEPCNSQVIRLVVSEDDKELRIE